MKATINSISVEHDYSGTKYPNIEKTLMNVGYYPNIGDTIVDNDENETTYKVIDKSIFIDEDGISLLYSIREPNT